MSRTTTIHYNDRWFWTFDEARAIWLKFLIEAVEGRVASGNPPRLTTDLYDWRIVATIGDYGLTLGPWTLAERDEFTEINRDACAALAASKPLALSEVMSWTGLDERRLVERSGLWGDPIDVRPILELGAAVDELVNGTLDESPRETRWLFGFKEGRRTLPDRSDQP